jgi:hypothetical protein
MVTLTLRLATSFFLLLATPAFASIGAITDFKGGGQIKRSSSTIPANKSSGIEKMDTVITNSQGKFGITFNDQTKVYITENSKLVIDDFVYDDNAKSKGKLGLKVALGTVRYTSGAIAHNNPNSVDIRTPTATIAVRGTDFLMSVDEVGRTTVILVPECFMNNGEIRMDKECETGAIEVATAAGVVKMDKPFQATVVETSSGPPSTPSVISMEGRSADNNIQLSTPSLEGGANLLTQARKDIKNKVNPAEAAADNNQDPDTGTDDLNQVFAALQRTPTPSELLQVYEEYNSDAPLKQTLYTDISPLLKKQIQIGWAYSLLSQAKLEVVTVVLPKATGVDITTIQDGSYDYYNFSEQKWPTSGTGRPNGHITIIQTNIANK